MWRCEEVKMWRCEDVKMRRCEDVMNTYDFIFFEKNTLRSGAQALTKERHVNNVNTMH